MERTWLARTATPLGTISLCSAMILALGCASVWACSDCGDKVVHESRHHSSCRDCGINTNVSLWGTDSAAGGEISDTYVDSSGREFSFAGETQWRCNSCEIAASYETVRAAPCSACSDCGEAKYYKTSCRDCGIDTNVSLWGNDNSAGGELSALYVDSSGRTFRMY